MAKNINENGVEMIDGRPVEVYRAKVVGAFETEAEDVIGWADGDFAAIILVVKVGTPKLFNVARTGQLGRENQLRVTDHYIMSKDKLKSLVDSLDGDIPGINTNLVTTSHIGDPVELGFDPKDLELD